MNAIKEVPEEIETIIDKINRNISALFKFEVYFQESDSLAPAHWRAKIITPYGEFKYFAIENLNWHTVYLFTEMLDIVHKQGIKEGKEKVISNICKAIGDL